MKKKRKQNIAIIIIAGIIIGSYVGYSYYIDQIKQKGFSFGNQLQQIQEDVKRLQTEFNSKITQWEEGDLAKDELLHEAEKHIEEFESVIDRYDELVAPEPFEASVELFKLSSRTQLESDMQFIEWIRTGDESFSTRSDVLLQESFEYEMAALGEFNAAKAGIKP